MEMRPPRNHANEESSSVGSLRPKRKRGESQNCHQCRRNDKERVIRCTKCLKNYCTVCVTKWYSRMDVADIAASCPDCRNICNCTACLQSDAAKKGKHIPDPEHSNKDQIQHSRYIVRALLPFLKQFVAEQDIERKEEAKIQGLSITELQLPQPDHQNNEPMQCCNKCKTSIFDIHRRCPNCSYTLCITCCREIRDGFLVGNGQYHVHVSGINNSTTNIGSSTAASFTVDDARLGYEWKLTGKSSIVCPPQVMGGCSSGDLVLTSTYTDNWVSKLVINAETVANVGNLTDADEVSEAACSCLRSDQGDALESAKTYKAASRQESNDNYLYCPTAVETELKHFQWHLSKGEPVIVSSVLSGTSGLSWEPLVLWRACRKSRRANDLPILDFSVLNCLNQCVEKVNMHKFFKGCLKGLFDSEGRLKILKLEDWPPTESFQERLPRHNAEFISCLPFKLYTHSQAGYLNMSVKLPVMSFKPDLGPKMCISYGIPRELGCDSITKLQYALSDRVSVLMHTAAICLNPEQLSKLESLRAALVAQDPVVCSISDERANETGKQNQETCEDPEGGAVWDIFRRQDVHKLEEYLLKHSEEFRHNPLLQQMVHPIHDKAFYLTAEHKRHLKEEYGIEPWTFVQRMGDAVFVPAGCPHQIRNLMSCTTVAVNFVSPESFGECIRQSMERRSLPDNHPHKEDKLRVKKLTLCAISQAMEYVNSNTPNTSRSATGRDFGAANANQNQANRGEGSSSGGRIDPIFVAVDIDLNLPNPDEGPIVESMRQDLSRINSSLDAYQNQANPVEGPNLESMKQDLSIMNSQIHNIPDRATRESLYVEIGHLLHKINLL